MMCVVDVLADSESQSAAGDHVRDVVFVHCESRHADSTCDTIGCDLDRAIVLVFISHHGCDGPYLSAVTGRERTSAIEEFTTLDAIRRPRALSDAFQRAFDDHTINHRFGT